MGARSGVDGLAEDLAAFRGLIGETNAVYERASALLESLLCGPAADRQIVDRMERAWQRRTFRAAYERPLLLLATLRYHALKGGADHPLAHAFSDEHPQVAAVTREALARALDPDRLPLWLVLATRKVQTNDVSRAVAWRWPAALAGDRPIALVDVGCSAGLGLVADSLAAPWVDDTGRRLQVDGGPVVARIGFDADPIALFEPGREDEVTWLRACVWPGDAERLRRLQSAIEAFSVAREGAVPPRIEQVRARTVPGRLRRLDRELDPHALVIVVQTFVREYIEQEEGESYAADMHEWLADIAPGRAVWTQLELAADGHEPVAELVAHCAGLAPLVIARCGYHPGTIVPIAPAVEELRSAIAR